MGRFTPAGFQHRGRAVPVRSLLDHQGRVDRRLYPNLARLVPGAPARPVVAVAVDGVIGGVSETLASGRLPPTRFSAIVSDSLLRPGGNRLQLFLVDPRRRRAALCPPQPHPLARANGLIGPPPGPTAPA